MMMVIDFSLSFGLVLIFNTQLFGIWPKWVMGTNLLSVDFYAFVPRDTMQVSPAQTGTNSSRSSTVNLFTNGFHGRHLLILLVILKDQVLGDHEHLTPSPFQCLESPRPGFQSWLWSCSWHTQSKAFNFHTACLTRRSVSKLINQGVFTVLF